MTYRKISWSLGATRLVAEIIASLWHLTGTSAALLPTCVSNFRAIGQVEVQILWLPDIKVYLSLYYIMHLRRKWNNSNWSWKHCQWNKPHGTVYLRWPIHTLYLLYCFTIWCCILVFIYLIFISQTGPNFFSKYSDTFLLYRPSVWNSVKKSCRSSCLEFQIINIRMKKNQQKVPSPPPQLSASDRRTCRNFQHCIDIDFTLSTRMLATLCNWNHSVISTIDWKNSKEKIIFTNFSSHQHLNLPCPTTAIIRPKFFFFFFAIGSVNTSSYSIGITLQDIFFTPPSPLTPYK